MVLGIYAGPGLAVAGEVMPRLPGSVRSLWGAAASGSAAPLRPRSRSGAQAMGMPVDGLVRVDLEVRRREPVTTGEAAAPPTATGERGPAPTWRA